MQNKISLNAFQLKMLAAALMLVDHIGYLLLPELPLLRLVGRLSFPLFAFMAANGYRHTASLNRYLLRLALFALLFQPLYAFCMSTDRLNIFATLFLGLLSIRAYQGLRLKLDGRAGLLAGLATALLIALAAYAVGADYGGYGVGLVFTAYVFWGRPALLCSAWLALSSLSFIPAAQLGVMQSWALLSLPLLFLYNGQKGRGWRWFFYAFYCLHIPALYLVRTILGFQ